MAGEQRPGDELAAAAEAAFDHNVALLRNGGWRVIPVRYGDKVAEVWGKAAGGGNSLPYFATGGAA